MHMYVVTQPVDMMWHKVNFYAKYSCFDFRLIFSKKKKLSLPNYVSIKTERKDGPMSFLRVSVQVKRKQLYPGFDLE